jgi:hypothetical protein
LAGRTRKPVTGHGRPITDDEEVDMARDQAADGVRSPEILPGDGEDILSRLRSWALGFWRLEVRPYAWIGVGTAVIGFGFTALSHRGPRVPAAYATLARHLADEHQPDLSLLDRQKRTEERLAEGRLALGELDGLRTEDPEIRRVVGLGRSALADAVAAAEKLHAPPRPPGTGELIAESFVHGVLGDVAGGFRLGREVQSQYDIMADEVRRLGDAIRRAEAAKLMLPGLAARFAGPEARGDAVLSLDFDTAWGPFGPDDLMTLSNASGKALHYCTVLVELRGAGGEVERNLHFVSDWAPGEKIFATYSPGTEVLGRVEGRETVPSVRSIAVSVWAEELSQGAVTFNYTPETRDADIARYCGGMAVEAAYRPFARGVLWNTERGVTVKLRGVRYLERPRITLRFTRGGSEAAFYWDFDRWNEGEVKTLDAGGRLGWDPERFRVEVGFPGTSYTHRSGWTVGRWDPGIEGNGS